MDIQRLRNKAAEKVLAYIMQDPTLKKYFNYAYAYRCHYFRTYWFHEDGQALSSVMADETGEVEPLDYIKARLKICDVKAGIPTISQAAASDSCAAFVAQYIVYSMMLCCCIDTVAEKFKSLQSKSFDFEVYDYFGQEHASDSMIPSNQANCVLAFDKFIEGSNITTQYIYTIGIYWKPDDIITRESFKTVPLMVYGFIDYVPDGFLYEDTRTKIDKLIEDMVQPSGMTNLQGLPAVIKSVLLGFDDVVANIEKILND